MIAKGVPWLTVAQVMGTLLPQALGLTIPMALLVALLVALGRLSGDREVVAMLACGLSPLRLLRPALRARHRRLGGHLVGDAVGDSRRQPDVPRADDAAGRRSRRRRGQAARLLRGLPRLRRLRAARSRPPAAGPASWRPTPGRPSTRCCSSPRAAGCSSTAASARFRWCSATAPATRRQRAIPTATRWCASARSCCRSIPRACSRAPGRRAASAR